MTRYKLIRHTDTLNYHDNDFIYYLYKRKLFRWVLITTKYNKKEMVTYIKNLLAKPLYEGTLEQISLMLGAKGNHDK